MRVLGWFSACALGFGPLVSLGGCFVDPGPIAAQSESMSTEMSVGSSTMTATSTTSAGTSTTSAPECDEMLDCAADEICVDGICVLAECEPVDRTKAYEEPAIMLLVDKSRSMVINLWNHDGDEDTPSVSRWNTVHAVVSELAVEGESTSDFGLKLFPDIGVPSGYDSAACGLSSIPDVGVSPGASASMGMVLPDANAMPMTDEIAGGSPASAAISAATEHLKGLAGSERSRFILMLTDGSANCRGDAIDDFQRFEVYDDTVIDRALEAVDLGIEVAVLGLDIAAVPNEIAVDGKPDGIIPSEVLSDLALSGGLPPDGENSLRNATDEGTLRAHFEEFMTLMRCTVEATPPPGGANLVSVQVAGVEVPVLPEGSGCSEDGWRDLGGGRLRLCGLACSLYMSVGSLDLGYVCL